MTDQSSQTTDLSESVHLAQLLFGFMASQAIAVAAKLGIADLLEESPKTVEELANETKAHAGSLNRLLRMLTSVAIFAEDANARFRQTPLSDLLRSNNPRSARSFAIMQGSSFIWKPWMLLDKAVMTGQSAAAHAFGAPIFDYLAANPQDAQVFNAGMTSGSALDASALVAAYDFSRFERIVDVGGGHGELLRAILLANPKLSGVLADQPAVVSGAEALRTGPLANRCTIAGVDFFTSVPEGADAYIMKWIIHDWNDEDSVKILGNCRRAIRPDGKLLVVDAVLRPPNEPDPGKLMDLNMLVMATGGRERTQPEFAELLRRAGFSLIRVIPTSARSSIVESRPV
jgi:SAM-dependent methyltransferase